MSEAQRVVLQEATHCRKCGKLLEPGTVVRAYPRQGGWVFYCAERCEKPRGPSATPWAASTPARPQAPTATPNRPTENQGLASLKDLVAAEQEKAQAFILLVQEIRDIRADLQELEKALQSQVAMAIGIADALKELVKAVKDLHPSRA